MEGRVVTQLKPRTVVFVGGGLTAALAARQLTAKNIDVLVLERGHDRSQGAEAKLPSQRDELRWSVHGGLFQDWAIQTYSLRHTGSETALPIRRLEAFLPGEGMGGAANHWNGQTWRWAEYDPILRTHLESRYGRKAIPAEMTIQDWGVTYAEMEPYHDLFEKLFGITGMTGNLRGRIQEGGNSFEGLRQNEYSRRPLPVRGRSPEYQAHRRNKECPRSGGPQRLSGDAEVMYADGPFGARGTARHRVLTQSKVIWN
jgi:gluconate 2-dehydrogenase alpha chain